MLFRNTLTKIPIRFFSYTTLIFLYIWRRTFDIDTNDPLWQTIVESITEENTFYIAIEQLEQLEVLMELDQIDFMSIKTKLEEFNKEFIQQVFFVQTLSFGAKAVGSEVLEWFSCCLA